jgi:hypothetical protein
MSGVCFRDNWAKFHLISQFSLDGFDLLRNDRLAVRDFCFTLFFRRFPSIGHLMFNFAVIFFFGSSLIDALVIGTLIPNDICKYIGKKRFREKTTRLLVAIPHADKYSCRDFAVIFPSFIAYCPFFGPRGIA